VQDELVVFIGKVMNIYVNMGLLCFEVIGHVTIKSVEVQAPKLFGSYVDWRKEFVAKDSSTMSFMEESILNAMKANGTDKDWDGKVDKQEYSCVMLMTLPLWTQAYFAKEIQPALKL